jgi:hypothetical protein
VAIRDGVRDVPRRLMSPRSEAGPLGAGDRSEIEAEGCRVDGVTDVLPGSAFS